MNDKYPLYPRLTEEGEVEAQAIMDSFKPRILSLVDELMGDLYTDISMHVESDHWSNYKNQMMDGFKDYGNGSKIHTHDFKELRKTIYANNKNEIIADLNQDLVEENERLKVELAEAYRNLNRY